jgi:threonine synthase
VQVDSIEQGGRLVPQVTVIYCFDRDISDCSYAGNTAYNPLTIEGKKTVSFEIYEQLGNRAPDVIFVPTGDGCILSGVARGFRDLKMLGLIERVPRLIAVQAEGSNAIALALANNCDISAIKARSVADSITVDLPRNGPMAVRDVRQSGGRAIVVSDEAILSAQYELASTTGIFAEPAAAASLAGLATYLEEAQGREDETIVLLVTGSGLKDIEAASRAAPPLISVDPTLDALEQFVD